MTGKVHKYGDNIDTDVIIPARYLNTSDAGVLASHCLEDLDPTFVSKVNKGDFLVAGKNFGCGSSREHAPLAIKSAGVCCVLAESFARIFFRNAINIGLPIVECKQAADDAIDGDNLQIDLKSGKIHNPRLGKTYGIPPYPAEIRQIIERGGLLGTL